MDVVDSFLFQQEFATEKNVNLRFHWLQTLTNAHFEEDDFYKKIRDLIIYKGASIFYNN